MADLHKIWHSDTEHVSHVHRPLKIFFLNPRWRTADMFERPVLHRREILNF